MADAFVFRAISVPFVLLTLGLVSVLGTLMLVRGNLTIRAVLGAACLVLVPWTGGTALTLNLVDPRLVELFAHIYVGCLVFSGPVWLLLVLSLTGSFERYRGLLYGFSAGAVVLCLLTWTTELIVDGVWRTSWGILQPRGGVLFPLFNGFLLVGIFTGAWMFRRLARGHRTPLPRAYLIFMFGAAVLATSDCLLFYEVGVYPFSAVPGLLAAGYTVWSLIWRDLLHARGSGVDRSAVWELVLFAIMAPLAAVAVWLATKAGSDGGVVIAVLLLVPLFGIVQALTSMLRGYTTVTGEVALDGEIEMALEEFGEMVEEPDDEAEVEKLLAELLVDNCRLRDPELYLAVSPGTWSRVDPSAPRVIEIAPVVEDWLLAQRRPLLAREFRSWRPGKLREPVTALFGDLEADVLVPLVERDRLVGVVLATASDDARALDAAEVELVREAGRLTARALTYIALFREAVQRIEMAKELEVASAAGGVRATGEQRYRYDLCDVIGYYQAARQFGGDWWTSEELDDGRVLVVVGEVSGHGVPAALVSSTVVGACETAVRLYGTDLAPDTLITLLNDSVVSIGSEHPQGMSCFAAIFDGDEVSFANAGYPYPYLCRRGDGDEDSLHALIARGTRLGTVGAAKSSALSMALEVDDVVLFYSDAVVDAASPSGERYGEERLEQLLREQGRVAGERLCRRLIDDVMAHCGDQVIADDLTLVAVHLGAGMRSRRRLRTGRPTAPL